MLAGPNLSTTHKNPESMGTTTAEPQTVPETKRRRADDVVLVENEAGPANEADALSRSLNWETLSKSQKAHWRKRN